MSCIEFTEIIIKIHEATDILGLCDGEASEFINNDGSVFSEGGSGGVGGCCCCLLGLILYCCVLVVVITWMI